MKAIFRKPLFYILILAIFVTISITEYEKIHNVLHKPNPSIGFVVKSNISKSIKPLKQYNNDIGYDRIYKKVQKRDEQIKNEKDDFEQDGPDKAFEQDFYRTMNLELKRPTPELLPAIVNENYLKLQSNKIALAIPGSSSSAPWVELGPNNVGGRTRTVTWDPNDSTGKKVWAGGVTGGLWYNNDITSNSSSWNKVDDFWQTLSITKIVFDSIDKKTAYVTTGESFGTSASIGAGIWKTTNAGATWSQLSSTSNFLYSNDLVVRTESGKSVVYAAIDGSFYMGKWLNSSNAGLYRSTDNGTTWAQTLPNITDTANTNKVPFVAASIQISKNNTITANARHIKIPTELIIV